MPIAFDAGPWVPSYHVEVDPEFPGNGIWGIADHHFGAGGHEDMALRVTAAAIAATGHDTLASLQRFLADSLAAQQPSERDT